MPIILLNPLDLADHDPEYARQLEETLKEEARKGVEKDERELSRRKFCKALSNEQHTVQSNGQPCPSALII